MRVTAPAKVNLRLRVLAREESGYHQIETVFCALELADALEVRLHLAGADAGEVALRVTGNPEVDPGPSNLVYRAARAFLGRARLRFAAEIELRKTIPVGAGLGGGSSDAAATLRALDTLARGALGDGAVLELGAALGADVPFFLCGSSLALAWGRGDRLLPLPPLPRAPVLLAVPPFGSNTAEAYGLLAAARRPGEYAGATAVDVARLASWDSVAEDAWNDFEAPLFARHPELAELREALARPPARFALLTGSGSALFAVFEDDDARDAAARELAARFPRVRFVPTATAEYGPGGRDGAADAG